jgi:hypothetical protein
MVYFMAVWYILWPFGNLPSGDLVYFFPVLVHCITKNLATLVAMVAGKHPPNPV